MRVIAGEAKGRRLKPVRSEAVRPMTDQIREALFSSLGERVTGARVLDLYSGSGSVGIEALSRGAARVTFVERDPKAITTIEQNLEATGFASRAEVRREEVERFVARTPPVRFDLVVVDPPFSVGLPSAVLEALARGGFLAPGATVVARISAIDSRSSAAGSFVVEDSRRYGDSTLLYLHLKED